MLTEKDKEMIGSKRLVVALFFATLTTVAVSFGVGIIVGILFF